MPRILLIDDDELLAPPLAAYLKRFDFELAWAGRPSEGLARLRDEPFDAAILDVMLPEMDGFELLRTIRRGGGPAAQMPLIMLTARGELPDKVVGLELGADDYLAKPFEPRELAARLTTVLRRHRPAAAAAPPAPPDQLRFDGIVVDLARREVRRHGSPVELTGTEFELLALLAGEPRKVFSRDEILNRLRGHDADLATRAVDILISRLRRKLEPLDCIKTLRNAGYAFAGAPVHTA
ncbi:response regulator transcription factor [Ideonella sp.]|uniref:response regulator transcription factor n=1 Tax=Ideonella sp. TaxID=1929293 RepID=UPI002B4761DF|nr:response regulator transcription factor [Ideonella sp.]HJV71641.1 response regulator transcription factor [Ideonella sp.]